MATARARVPVLLLIGVSILWSVPPSPLNAAATAQVLRLSIPGEPASLDPLRIDNRVAGTLAKQLFEGLTRLDKSGDVVPGVAERWVVSPDAMVYTFELRRDARWSNGDPVTAHDFVYSYRRMLKPKSGAPLVGNLYFIANAEQYNAGKLIDPAKVGLRAIGDSTLEIRLHTPAPFFLKLLAFMSSLPISQRAEQQSVGWMNSAATFVSNGAYRLARWDHERGMVFEPNPNYWAREQVRLDRIQIGLVPNPATAYQMFVTDQLDVVEPVPAELVGRLIAKNKATVIPEARTWLVFVNNKRPPFTNVDIRKAFSLSINRAGISRILGGGPISLRGFIPHGLSSGTGEFRKQAGDLYADNDVQRAREHLQRGLKELGLARLPQIAMRVSNRTISTKIAQALQALQAQWKQALGTQVTIETMEERAFFAALDKGNYTLAPESTGADYDDAYNLITWFLSDFPWNPTIGYRNPGVDRLLRTAGKETDLKKRARLMIDAERIAIGQDMAVAPLFTNVRVIVQNPRLRNVYRYAVAEDDYRHASFGP